MGPLTWWERFSLRVVAEFRARVLRIWCWASRAHDWQDEHGPARGMSMTGSWCARCWKPF